MASLYLSFSFFLSLSLFFCLVYGLVDVCSGSEKLQKVMPHQTNSVNYSRIKTRQIAPENPWIYSSKRVVY